MDCLYVSRSLFRKFDGEKGMHLARSRSNKEMNCIKARRRPHIESTRDCCLAQLSLVENVMQLSIWYLRGRGAGDISVLLVWQFSS